MKKANFIWAVIKNDPPFGEGIASVELKPGVMAPMVTTWVELVPKFRELAARATTETGVKHTLVKFQRVRDD